MKPLCLKTTGFLQPLAEGEMCTSVFLFLGSFKMSPKGHPRTVGRDQQQNLKKQPVHQQNKPDGLGIDVRSKQAAARDSGAKGGAKYFRGAAKEVAGDAAMLNCWEPAATTDPGATNPEKVRLRRGWK